MATWTQMERKAFNRKARPAAPAGLFDLTDIADLTTEGTLFDFADIEAEAEIEIPTEVDELGEIEIPIDETEVEASIAELNRIANLPLFSTERIISDTAYWAQDIPGQAERVRTGRAAVMVHTKVHRGGTYVYIKAIRGVRLGDGTFFTGGFALETKTKLGTGEPMAVASRFLTEVYGLDDSTNRTVETHYSRDWK